MIFLKEKKKFPNPSSQQKFFPLFHVFPAQQYIVLQQVLVAVPIEVTVVDHVHSCTVRLSNTPPVLKVTMEKNEVTAVGYAAAVLQAAQLSHPKLALSIVKDADDTLVPPNVSIVDIQRQDALRRLTVT